MVPVIALRLLPLALLLSFCTGCVKEIALGVDNGPMVSILGYFCGLRSDGTLICSSQPDRAGLSYWAYPVKSSWADFFLDFGAAWCGVYTNGSADCSQHATSGNENGAPNVIPPGFTWKKLTIAHHITRPAVTCGIKSDDTAECWPYTNSTILDPFTWKQLRPQVFYTCGINTANDMFCWVNNVPSSSPSQTDAQIDVPQGYSWKTFASNWAGACGIKMDGTILCWGSSMATPPSGSTWEKIYSGWTGFCAIQADGDAVCWGASSIENIPAGYLWTQFAISTYSACGLTTLGSVLCWGTAWFLPTLPRDLYCCSTGEIGLDCQVCAAGTYRADPNTCQECLPGNFSTAGSDVCLVCAPGSYSDVSAAPSCTPCPAGTYNIVNGSTASTSCTPCPAGTFGPAAGATSCIPCALTTSSGSTVCGGAGPSNTDLASSPQAIALYSLSGALSVATIVFFIKACFSKKRIQPAMTQRNSMPKQQLLQKSNIAAVVRLGSVIRGYELMAELDKGTSTQTFKVRKVSTGEVFALKMALNSDIERETQNLHGAFSLSSLHHENIVRFIEAFPYEASTDRQMIVPTGNQRSWQNERFLCIVMEYCDGGNISTMISNRRLQPQTVCISEYDVMCICVPLVEALVYIHEIGVIHCDIRPHNILLSGDRKTPKWTGGSWQSHSSSYSTSSMNGTLMTSSSAYMAPETLGKNMWTAKSDVWSLGVVLLDICTLTFAWESNTTSSIHSMTQKQIARVCDSLPDSYTSDFKLLLKKMLQLDPSDRLTSSQLLLETPIQDWKRTEKNQLRHPSATSISIHPATVKPKGRTVPVAVDSQLSPHHFSLPGIVPSF